MNKAVRHLELASARVRIHCQSRKGESFVSESSVTLLPLSVTRIALDAKELVSSLLSLVIPMAVEEGGSGGGAVAVPLEESEVDPLSRQGDKVGPEGGGSKGQDKEEEGVSAYEAIMGTVRSYAVRTLGAAATPEASSAGGKGEKGGKADSEWGGAEYWQDEHWRTALEELFYNNREKRKEKQDDMVFYVYDQVLNERWKSKKKDKGGASKSGKLDVTVRRFGSGVLKDEDFGGIQWMESVYLNLLLHTTYTCTVAICSKTALERHKSGQAEPALPVFKTSRQVYASHTHISINLKTNSGSGKFDKKDNFDFKNAVELAYPQVYFSIDDFEDAFEDLIVEDEDHCLCVLLYARDGPTFKWKGSAAATAQGDQGKKSNNLGQNKKVSLFSGYVPYSHLWKAVSKQARGTSVGGFLGISSGSATSNEQPEKLVMRGPGGKGHAEVAVTLLNRKTVHTTDPLPDPSEGGEGAEQVRNADEGKRGLRGLFAAMQSNISLPIIGSRSPSSATTRSKTTQHIRCCLMNVSLPWQSLCHDILKSSRMM
ncbi:DUF2045 domain-containing protein [Chloropicon primus]|uniref:DUF2045 domain-containing protein n=1 Tax=Chloropicon primus TaxID=1764295 RepID=A0A5B8N1Q3_9CHLO|nr:DUF2045 domain-containing protein [Chloropicon primus]UPR05263.1 DUF2045 domain-containing protein [Chloropicon primus]|eukprot:QDZ26062.1 DUF2045 domain-containing protein [Chloropicon primus]